MGHCEEETRCCSFLRGPSICIVNNTASLLVVHVAPKQNNYTLQTLGASAGAGLTGGSTAGQLQWVADKQGEKTQRLLIQPGKAEPVVLQTRDGAYLTVCREQEVEGRMRDVVVGELDRFLTRGSRYVLTTGRA